MIDFRTIFGSPTLLAIQDAFPQLNQFDLIVSGADQHMFTYSLTDNSIIPPWSVWRILADDECVVLLQYTTDTYTANIQRRGHMSSIVTYSAGYDLVREWRLELANPALFNRIATLLNAV